MTGRVKIPWVLIAVWAVPAVFNLVGIAAGRSDWKSFVAVLGGGYVAHAFYLLERVVVANERIADEIESWEDQ